MPQEHHGHHHDGGADPRREELNELLADRFAADEETRLEVGHHVCAQADGHAGEDRDDDRGHDLVRGDCQEDRDADESHARHRADVGHTRCLGHDDARDEEPGSSGCGEGDRTPDAQVGEVPGSVGDGSERHDDGDADDPCGHLVGPSATLLGGGCLLDRLDGGEHDRHRENDRHDRGSDQHADPFRTDHSPVRRVGHVSIGIARDVAAADEHGADDEVRDESGHGESEAATTGQEAGAEVHHRHVDRDGACADGHVLGKTEQFADLPHLGNVPDFDEDGDRSGEHGAAEEKLELPSTLAGRPEDGGDRDARRELESRVVDHLLAQRDDDSRTDDRACGSGDADDPRVEFLTHQVQGGSREDDAGGDRVHARCHRLADVNFDDRPTLHCAPEDAEADDRSDRGSADREPQLECGVRERHAQHKAGHQTDRHSSKGYFAVWPCHVNTPYTLF